MGLRDKIVAWLDRDGDGHLGLNDVKVGAQQAGAAVHRTLDIDGDGHLSVNDARMKYADILDSSVKKAGSVWHSLYTQPVMWIGVFGVVVSAFISYGYYSLQYEGDAGRAFGAVMALIALSNLFAFYYYNQLSWSREPSDKLIALAWILGVCFFDIWAFAGAMTHSDDVSHNTGLAKASFAQDNLNSVQGLVARKKKIRQIIAGDKLPKADAGLAAPRSVDLIKADLALEGEKYFCRKSGKSWCYIGKYCKGRQNSSRCATWSKLNSELSLSREYSNLEAQLAGLKAPTTSGDVATSVDTHAATLSRMTGKSLKDARANMGVWQGTALELILMAILHMSTGHAIRQAAGKREAQIALRRAQMREQADELIDGVTGDMVGQMQGKLREMIDNPVAASAHGLVSTTAVDAPSPAPAAAVQPVRLDQLYRWREEAMQESMGSWVSLAQAYDAYARWASRNGLIALLPDGDDGFHEQIKSSRLLVPVENAQHGLGYGGMIERAVA